MGRSLLRHIPDRVQSILFEGLTPEHQMSHVDWIKGSSHNSDLFHGLSGLLSLLRQNDLPFFLILCLLVKYNLFSDYLDNL